MEFKDKNQNDLNPAVLMFLKNRIYLLERENNKTKKMTNVQMVEKLRQIIERAAANDN